MKHVWLLGLGFIMLGSTGCATKGYVREQVDPLAQRLDKIETCVRSMNQRLGDMEKKPAATTADLDAVRRDLADTRNQLQQAGVGQQGAGQPGAGQQTPAARAEAAATRAEAAAGRAEAAADKANKSAEKSTRAFELGQRK